MSTATLSVAELLALPAPDRAAWLERCCGARAFVLGMLRALAAAPVADVPRVLALADAVFDRFATADWLEAFGHHPKIGDLAGLRQRFAPSADLAHREQGAVAGATEATLRALQDGNLEYERRFGFIFIVCASGKSAAEMLELLRQRLGNERAGEIAIAAVEQRRITHRRLRGMLSPAAS